MVLAALLGILSLRISAVLDHGLDARLVVHVLDEFLGGFVSHSIRLGLVPEKLRQLRSPYHRVHPLSCVCVPELVLSLR